ncbi:hypothetical protein TWF694_000282 [Orbilia ellipsospora]|uniref:AB hydrolase-1 domain-containing protein n=1 Tax=Orbilia ellipsospora TaxID=2528407 RepID=A0AAV9XPI9_9PEZI
MTSIKIPKGSIELAGLLFAPSSIPSSPGISVVIVHPGGGVKEQTAKVYAEALSQPPNNYTTICYDASYQGASGGEPHFLEDPSARVSDISAVIDYLTSSVPHVDASKIGVVGICAGGGYAVAAAKGDYRIKSVCTVSMVNIGDSFRLGWEGKDSVLNHISTLQTAADERAAKIKGAEPQYAPYVPARYEEKTPYDLKQGSEYYLTPRGQHPNAQNKMLVSSFPLILTWDAFALADIFLKQPVCCVFGSKAGSKWHSDRLDEILKLNAGKGVDRMVEVEEATHMDFYDREKFVGKAVEEVGAFMREMII